MRNIRTGRSPRITATGGFTLIEVLVTILIIGALAAIAIPALLSQQGKGTDAEAKSTAALSERALEACATDHDGQYSDCDQVALESIEPTLTDAHARINLDLHADHYAVTVESKRSASVTFSIARNVDGSVTRWCQVSGGQARGGCPPGDSW